MLCVILCCKIVGRTIAQSAHALALKVYDFSSCTPMSYILSPPSNETLTMQFLKQVFTARSYFLSYQSKWLRACTSEEATTLYQEHKYPSSWI